MPAVIGLDLGTTTITALALDTTTGKVICSRTVPTPASSATQPGRFEWDVTEIACAACDALRDLGRHLGARTKNLVGLGITGQQHGVVLLRDGEPIPGVSFINWQDKRGDERCPTESGTWVDAARQRVGEAAPARAGCRLATGYMGMTLFWIRQAMRLPARSRACFLMDYVGSYLTGQPPVTDATCAASSGIFNVAAGDWDEEAIAALNLSRALFPAIRPSGERLGGLTSSLAVATGLPADLPVYGGIGDNQASFLGTVGPREDCILINVGTGGQVGAWMPTFRHVPDLETRPFPGEGYLLVAAGLSGGAAYATLERFIRKVASEVVGRDVPEVYGVLESLAGKVPHGADGLTCEPFFTGTRREPGRRATLAGLSADNFTPGHLARAVLEGMARTFAQGRARIDEVLGREPGQVVGAGNGMRNNPLLAVILARTLATTLHLPNHREEAAFGAALLAAHRGGVFRTLAEAAQLIRYNTLDATA